MSKKDQNQREIDIESVINFLKTSDPDNATREHAIEMLENMQDLAHLIAHKVVEDENSGEAEFKKPN
jgi:hypothetical protein